MADRISDADLETLVKVAVAGLDDASTGAAFIGTLNGIMRHVVETMPELKPIHAAIERAMRRQVAWIAEQDANHDR